MKVYIPEKSHKVTKMRAEGETSTTVWKLEGRCLHRTGMSDQRMPTTTRGEAQAHGFVRPPQRAGGWAQEEGGLEADAAGPFTACPTALGDGVPHQLLADRRCFSGEDNQIPPGGQQVEDAACERAVMVTECRDPTQHPEGPALALAEVGDAPLRGCVPA